MVYLWSPERNKIVFDVSVSVSDAVVIQRVIPTEAQLAGYLEQIPDLIATTGASRITVTIETKATGHPSLFNIQER